MGTVASIPALSVEVARQGQAIEDLEKWQAKQNGSLQRLETKLDTSVQELRGTLYKLLLTLIGGTVSILGAMIALYLKK